MIRALAADALRRRLQGRMACLAGLFFVLVLIAGHAPGWRYGEIAAEGDRWFGFGYIAAAAMVVRLGWADDRVRGFDEYLTVNFVHARDYLGAKLLALLGTIAAAGAFGFLAALAISGGDPVYAGWYAAAYSIEAALLVPLIVGIECASDVTVPAPAAILVFFVAALIAEPLVGIERLMTWIGLPDRPYDPAQLARFAGRVLIIDVMALALLYPACARRLGDGGTLRPES